MTIETRFRPGDSIGDPADARTAWPIALPIDLPVTLPDGPLREAITQATALGFLAGALVRLAATGAGGAPGLLLAAVAIPLGALAAALAAGITVNLIALPALARLVPGRQLPDRAYRTAGALCALAAFGGAFADWASAQA